MADIRILVETAFRNGAARPCPARQENTYQRWRARFAETGEQIGDTYLAPFTGAARELIEQGYDPDDMLVLVYPDEPGKWKIRAKLGVAAKLTVHERNEGEDPAHFAKWQAFDRDRADMEKENPA